MACLILSRVVSNCFTYKYLSVLFLRRVNIVVMEFILISCWMLGVFANHSREVMLLVEVKSSLLWSSCREIF